MNYDYLHETETVRFEADQPRSCRDLARILRRLGFTRHEDVFSLDRKGRIEPWEFSSWADVDMLLNGEETFNLGGQWDTVNLVYLLATLPREGISTFVTAATQVSESLGLPMKYKDQVVGAKELEEALNACADELEREVGEPGSQTVNIFIQSTYPRRQ